MIGAEGIRVEILDLETGERDTRVITGDDYWVVCAGLAYVSDIYTYPSGTQRLTIRRESRDVQLQAKRRRRDER